MELNFAYKIYFGKEKLEEVLKYILKNTEEESVDFEFQGDQLFHIDRSIVGMVKTKTTADKLQKFNCAIIADNDISIVNYYLNYLAATFNISVDSPENTLKNWQANKDQFIIGNIEAYISDYSDKIENLLELSFYATAPDMSVLFVESVSINKFFKKFCFDIKADHSYLYKGEYGIQLIWLDGDECDYAVPAYWDSFQHYGVIPVIKTILDSAI